MTLQFTVAGFEQSSFVSHHQIKIAFHIITQKWVLLSCHSLTASAVASILCNGWALQVDTYYASEVEPHAIRLTKHNFPDTIHLGDVHKVRGVAL
jgi:hypothetical protein